MESTRDRSRRKTLLVAVPVLLGLCAAVLILMQPRENTAAAVVASSRNRISNINLDVRVNPTVVLQGEVTQVHFLVMIRGGPGAVTIAGRFPKNDGGEYQVGFTLMLDRDAVYGFDVPFEANVSPGTHNITVKAAAFTDTRVSSTRNVSLTVRPGEAP